MLFFVFFVFSHSMIGFLIGLVIAVVITVILTRMLSGNSFNGMNAQQPWQGYYQPGQQYYQPNNQPNAPYYQPSESPYQSYDQGYQAPVTPQAPDQGNAAYYEPPVQNIPYRGEYEEPQTQYPDQAPPMQQQ